MLALQVQGMVRDGHIGYARQGMKQLLSVSGGHPAQGDSALGCVREKEDQGWCWLCRCRPWKKTHETHGMQDINVSLLIISVAVSEVVSIKL